MKGFKLTRLDVLAVAYAVSLAGNAATITVDNVQQRWPWSNKVDVTYTIAGADLDAKVGKVALTAIVNGTSYVAYDGPVGDAKPGTFTVTWENPPAGVKRDDCKMYAALHTLPVREGNDYMVVNLVTGEVAYEGLFTGEDVLGGLSGQELSNARYNVEKYKSTHMVLRKVPKGTYKAKRGTGAFKEWTTDKDYYIGIFNWTTAQYGYVIKRQDGTDATPWDAWELKSRKWAPSVIRGNIDPAGTVPTYESVEAAINARQWRPLELLNVKTGMYFDIPTELMHEIACRAGTETTFYWGENADLAPQYAVYGISTIGQDLYGPYPEPVGTRLPNAWGLYDMVGNDWQWCRNRLNETEPADVFTPGEGGNNATWYVRGETVFAAKATQLTCDVRSSAPSSPGGRYVGYGFRAAYIVPASGE